ncbi:hypothetical protein TYRP_014236 [Tyrophagus putrescentiae]|nr:hypothetical protein TYRP_014236 [Tyrophagus putrescentiae]
MTASDKESGAPAKLPYPKSVIFIIGTELCERFSYYGMKAILVLYFRFVLYYSDDAATQMYHIFAMCCYFTPVLGAIIADSLLGKFWTILSISVVYAGGNILLAIASIKGTVVLTFIGLFLIAFGTGGIKPCVSAFGSLISTFITPILRQDVECMGRNDCYPLAFGVPAILMVTALSLFFLGKFLTNYVMVPPKKDNVVVMVCKCVFHALSGKIFSRGVKRDHWLDYADDQYDSTTIADVKVLMRVLFLYLPLPIFWALFDQTGSRWTLQALRMNGQTGGWTIKPDQIQVINPLLIILMIPVYEYVFYPIFRKIGITRPLQRMTVGGILAGISFFIVGFIQLAIESESPGELVSGHNHAVFVNSYKCQLEFSGQLIDVNRVTVFPNVPRENFTTMTFNVKSGIDGCTEKSFTVSPSINPTQLNDKSNALIFLSEKLVSSQTVDAAIFNNTLVKPENGGALLFTVFNLLNYNNEKFSSTETNQEVVATVVNNGSATEATFGYLNEFEVEIKGKDVIMSVGAVKSHLKLDQGASYVQLISGDLKDTKAPKSMKAVLQACWLLTVAFGNLIIAIIADAKIFPFQSYEFFFFAGLMIIDMGIFALMAYYYVPSKLAEEEEAENEKTTDENGSSPVPYGNGKAEKWDDD